MLYLQHPEVGTRRCEDCKKWLYDEETGARKVYPGTGKPIERPAYATVRCETPKGCPRGKPENEMRGFNRLCYYHYLQCKAVGDWPEDTIVRQNAALIRSVEDEVARAIQLRTCKATENMTRLLRAWMSALANAAT